MLLFHRCHRKIASRYSSRNFYTSSLGFVRLILAGRENERTGGAKNRKRSIVVVRRKALFVEGVITVVENTGFGDAVAAFPSKGRRLV